VVHPTSCISSLPLIAQILHEAEKAKKMAERKDYYQILGVDRDASPRDVKQVESWGWNAAPLMC
jgi:preprotein translocase subunit Sec63